MLSVALEYAQWAIETIDSADVLEHLPIVKTAAAAASAIRSVHDAMLLSKLEAFVTPLAAVTADQRREMVKRLEADPKYRRRVGEHMVELLDRLESHRKPIMVGEIFAAFAREQIDTVLLHRLVSAVERLPTIEIDNVRRFVDSRSEPIERQTIDEESKFALVSAGLAATHVKSGYGGSMTHFLPNLTCAKFLELALDTKSSRDQ